MEKVYHSRQNKYIDQNDTQAKQMDVLFQRNRHTITSQYEKHK